MIKALFASTLTLFMANANAFGPVSVPESSSWLLLLAGIISLFAVTRNK